MAIPSFSIVRVILQTLAVITCTTLVYALPCQARNGDDWVLVERFQSQQKQAQAGDASAMFEVGRMYELGRGTEPSTQKAIQWYERAMQKGQNNARARLGVMYFEGSGVKRNLYKAATMLEVAAKGGSAIAQYYLGKMYEQGEGMEQDISLAIRWYKKASDNGNYLAIDRLKVLERTSSSRPAIVRQAPTPALPATRSESPASVLLKAVMNARWQRNGQATGFLPSANSICTRSANQVVTCKSGVQQRNTGDAVITFVTVATLSGFTNMDEFQVKYYNNVQKVKPVARPSLGDEASTPRAPPNIKLGKQSMIHKLRCEMQSIDRLVCVKDNNSTDTYTRVK